MDIQFVAELLAWIGGICGVALLVMLLASILMGADWDFDFEADTESEGFGILKSILTFVSIASLTIRAIALHSSWSWTYAILTGIGAGIVAVLILYLLFKFLLGQQEDGSWKLWEAEGKIGEVYVPIPENGVGKVIVQVGGADRELDAKSRTGEALPTHTKIIVSHTENGLVVVAKSNNHNEIP
jgi:membrane protein implicated in regulation of membrane protease activity